MRGRVVSDIQTRDEDQRVYMSDTTRMWLVKRKNLKIIQKEVILTDKMRKTFFENFVYVDNSSLKLNIDTDTRRGEWGSGISESV